MDIRHLTGRVSPVAPSPVQQQKPTSANTGESFAGILSRVSGDKNQLQFSGHALKRLEERNIQLNESDLSRLQEAVDRAAGKGSKESLIMDGNNAFVVNVPNRTVITAVDQLDMRERVFTQIDSAVFTNKQ
ncbi:MAG TPA: TIGR02530 family flagellar biosynthesis protein [Balneolales bacterium]|nr:TIGR02530 family flagellar biosynthesis protein [Balneolales bacterium]